MSGTEYTLTPNLGLYKPIYDQDAEMWGTHLNLNADTLDAALASSGAGALFLPLAGGTMRGAITLAGDAAASLQPVTLQQQTAALGNYLSLAGGGTVTAATTFSAGPTGLNVTNSATVGGALSAATLSISGASTFTGPTTFSAPLTIPGGSSGPWLLITGGVLSGALTLAGNATTSLQPVTLQQMNAALPGPATVAPLMDSAAAVGTSLLYARQDHVHGSDTSRLATAGGTISGNLAITGTLAVTGIPTGPTAAPGTSTTQFATTAFVAAATGAEVSSWNTRTGAVTMTNADVIAVLPASSTTPLMDGTAAIGTATTWAKADHIHPSDTSRYAASNPSGYINAAGAPVQSVATRTGAITLTHSDITDWSSSISQPATVAPLMDSTAAVGTSLLYARQDHIHGSDTTKAPLASPSFTGTVTIGGTITGAGMTAWAASPPAIGSTTASSGAFTTLSASSTVSGAGFTTLLSPYAPLASPTFTGTPAAPTAAASTNTTQVATCAFVTTAIPLILTTTGAASVTGTTAETNLSSFHIPANTIGKNGMIEIKALYTYTNSANTKTLVCRFGSASGTAGANLPNQIVTTTLTAQLIWILRANNATNAQIAWAGNPTGPFGTGTAAFNTNTIDTTADSYINLTGILTVTTETITLQHAMVTVYPHAN